MRGLLHGFINYHSIAPTSNCPSNPVLTALGRDPQGHAGDCFEAAINRFTPDPGVIANPDLPTSAQPTLSREHSARQRDLLPVETLLALTPGVVSTPTVLVGSSPKGDLAAPLLSGT
jgi:hypothetical protein